MKLVVFGPFKRLGALQADGKIVDLNLAYTESLKAKGVARAEAQANLEVPVSLLAFIEQGDAGLKAASKVIAYAKRKKGALITNENDVKIWAPVPSMASRIICAGSNFADHGAGAVAAQQGRKVTQADIDQIMRETEEGKHVQWGFWKFPQNIIGPDEPMVYPARAKYLDYEVELVAILGKKGKNIPNKPESMDLVYGYTAMNDWSVRQDPLAQRGPSDWVMHKNFDTSCSLGPCVVTKDEIPDPYQLLLQLWVNGELRQNGRATLMMRRFPAWMQRLSTDMTLYPGDMIASGTPSGTAMDSSPKDKDGKVAHDRFLNVGDVVELKVENIGSIKNKIVAE